LALEVTTLFRPTGGVAVIRVGGATEVEVKERKDRVDDAMHATRAAVEEGIVPGGGVALLRASEHLKGLRTKNDDQKTGVEIVRKALSAPARQIAINAGEDGSVIVGKILEKDQYSYGFNSQAGEYVNLISKGIIDPTKVVRVAIQNAASVAALLIITEAMVADVPKKNAGGGMPSGGGGMGGMGGMDFQANRSELVQIRKARQRCWARGGAPDDDPRVVGARCLRYVILRDRRRGGPFWSMRPAPPVPTAQQAA
jgi:chaperonin GroEL